MHDFTFFITSYNYGNYIGNAINSIFAQTNQKWNLYILDNGSTDNTFEVITPYLTDSRVQLIRRPTNIGPLMNIALGFIELEGKYISTLQADDWIEPTFVEKALQAFSQYPDIPLVAHGWMAYSDTNDTFSYATTIPYPRSFAGLVALSPHLTLGNFIPLHMIAFRKQEIAIIFQEICNAPLQQLMEQYIIKRLEDRNGPSYFSAETAGYWRRHGSQHTNINFHNNITSIETIVEPLIYNLTKDNNYNSYTRFLSLVYFISNSTKTPYQSATEWLLSKNGQHLAEQYGVNTENTIQLQCLACALMMSHIALTDTTLTDSALIDDKKTKNWITLLHEKHGTEKREILNIANGVFNGYLFTPEMESSILSHFDKHSNRNLQIDTSHNKYDPNLNIRYRYPKWLEQRSFLETDTRFIFNDSKPARQNKYKFHLIIRLPENSTSLLADTLDSLNQLIDSDWHLDIFSTLRSPDGMDNIPCLDWHTIDSLEEVKSSIDFIVRARNLNWVIELPVGARLDILFLWRIDYEIRIDQTASVFFFDDDCCNSNGMRIDPRFKPGVNIEALRSSDLAGPICVRTNLWLESGGTSQQSGSPWFEKLLQITDKSGWDSIKHIPDILITYPDQFPADFNSCSLALNNSLKARGIEGEIRSVTPHSWCVRYALKIKPEVTIAIHSVGQFELLKRCLNSALEFTDYPSYEILVVTNKIDCDPDFDEWLKNIQTSSQNPIIRIVLVPTEANYAMRCNAAIASAKNELVVLAREEAVFVQSIWLEELVAALQPADIVAAAPLIHQAGDAKVLASGQILGLLGEYSSPHSGQADLGDPGYLDCLQVSRDTVALGPSCFLIRKTAYQTAGGMDENSLGDFFAETDLCLKLHQSQQRLIVHPRASVIYGRDSSQFDFRQRAEATVKKMAATEAIRQRWGSASVVDPYWNKNLSIWNTTPQPETEYRALWQFLPSDKPRIMADPLGNGQGDFRVTHPLDALRKAGLASPCIWRPSARYRYLSATEICRWNPTTLIIQNYIHDNSLAALKDWKLLKKLPFLIYTLDDLINDLDKTNPFHKDIPPNARSRLKHALSHCDRLVLSTDFLADTYRHFIDDIKVVPNRLHKDIWLPLNSKRQTSKKPRIGWAGGTTHEGDLILLKDIIEQTRHEADWVFFGMCPDAIRPMLSEFHELVSFDAYPAYLASLNLDIAVAPLAMTPFNQGKSNLRLLEFGALGIPVVCTDIDPYWHSPACRVKNSPKEWVAALRERIYEVDAREAEGNAMRDWMHRSYFLEDHLDDWLNAHLPS
jgi:GT2 family glycosyltransferase/glycosyltransferase involved in cell wall biosynthesis